MTDGEPTEAKLIAVIGWGPLLWDPRTLRISSGWHDDGPLLPVEFARESKGKRVTLVALPGYRHRSSTYWALSSRSDLDEAIEDLRVRETNAPPRHIHWARPGGDYGSGEAGFRPDPRIGEAVLGWLDGRPDLDAAVWTGLPPRNFDPDSPVVDLADQVLTYLRSLSAGEDVEARWYVEMAPPSIDTPVRRAIEAALGWRRRGPDPSPYGSAPGD